MGIKTDANKGMEFNMNSIGAREETTEMEVGTLAGDIPDDSMNVVYEDNTPESFEITEEQVCELIFLALTEKPNLVINLSNEINRVVLEEISDTIMGIADIDVDIHSAYLSNAKIRNVLNMIAKGFLVSTNFENTIPNDLKIFVYNPNAGEDLEYISLDSRNGIGVYNGLASINHGFTSENINMIPVIAKIGMHLSGKKDLYETMVEMSSGVVTNFGGKERGAMFDKISMLDNTELAKMLNKGEINKEQLKTVIDAERCNSIVQLAMALRKYN